jgi:hypothetical protein
VFGNRVLRRIFRHEREEVAGGWRRLHIEELHNLYSSSNIIRMIKLRRMKGAWHVARKGGMRKHTKFWYEYRKTDNPKDLGVDGMIILQWISGKKCRKAVVNTIMNLRDP